jgi:hypothetical protein
MIKIKQPIQFLSKNYFNENAQVDVVGDPINWQGLVDFKPFIENKILKNNSRETEFTVWLKDDFAQFVSKEIDTVILQNINWNTFEIIAVLNDATEAPLFTAINNGSANIKFTIPNKLMTGKLIFRIHSINNLDEAIFAGQVRICKSILKLQAFTETEINPVVDDGDLRTFDGSLVAWTNYEKWGAKINARNIQKAQYDLLKKFIKDDGFITIIPWYEWEPKDIYECLIKRGNIGTYAVNRWSGLISQSLTFEAKENAYN